jgi:hypothetical protein
MFEKKYSFIRSLKAENERIRKDKESMTEKNEPKKAPVVPSKMGPYFHNRSAHECMSFHVVSCK